MQITLERLNDSKHFRATNDEGHSIELSGDGNAVGPMQSVLMAAAGCSTIDIVMILEKMRQPLEDIKVEVTAKRREEIPKTFTEIHLHYILKGDLKDKKVAQAVSSSLEKYCSVSLMLEKAATVSSSYEIVS